jgi:hypothetical protein
VTLINLNNQFKFVNDVVTMFRDIPENEIPNLMFTLP